MRYFLVSESTYFVDPHGEADFGGEKKFVSNDESYAQYIGEDEDDEDHEDWTGSEDGYNAEYQDYYVIELTKEQADKATDIINSIT